MTDLRLFVGRGVRLPGRMAGDSLLVADDAVVGVGQVVEMSRLLPAGGVCRVERVNGYIIPGLRDSHLHPVAYGSMLTGVHLHRVGSIADMQRVLSAAAHRRPGPITGTRLDEATMAEARLPQAADLDAVSADRPVVVHRYDGHLAIVNTAAMHMAGIDASTPDPPGGVIDRDERGLPTGVLRETAIDIVTTAPGMESPVDPADVAAAMRSLAQLGITSIGAMARSGKGPWGHLGDEAAILAEAAPDIPIRTHVFLTAESEEMLEAASGLIDNATDRMDWAGVKRFADGSFGSHTAAMFEPFSDAPTETGTMRLNELDVAMAHVAVNAGRAVAIHAIGDAAAARVLDLFEHLAGEGVESHRLRMEHASVLAAPDIERMGRLGAVASVQPAFIGSEVDWIEGRIGRDRLERTYAFRSLIDSGTLVVGGSDSPVESPDPWEAMALCRDRKGLVPEQAIGAAEALAMYTTNAAAALGEPEPLAPGSPADFAIVDRDPVTATPEELRATDVLATYVAGRRVEIDPDVKWWID